MNTKCEHCPLKGAATECPAITLNHRIYCGKVDPNHPKYDPRYIPIIEAKAANLPIPQRDPFFHDPLRPKVAIGETKSPLAEKLMAVYECDYRVDDRAECACTARKYCGLGRGTFATEPHKVTLQDCLRCVSDLDEKRATASV